MPGFLSVKNWEKYQHYQTGKRAKGAPPWIKLYRSLLADYAFGCLHDASKYHLIALYLLASETQNRIPYDADWIARRIGATETIDLEGIARAGFIEIERREQDASVALAKSLPRSRERREKKNTPAARESGPQVSSSGHASWVQAAVALWATHIGLVKHPRMGAALKDAVTLYGWERVARWLDAYVRFKPYQRRDGSFPSGPDEVGEKNTTWCNPEDFVKNITFWRELVETPEAA